jgi:hypothetical protein
MASEIIVSGFDKEAVNGTYIYWKQVDGRAAYQKDATHILLYQEKLGQVSENGSYYLMENKQISGGIPTWVTIARAEGTSIESGTWITLKEITSGEDTVGSFADESSSSSSLEYSSSSSSSSLGYSSSSSS